MPKRLKPESLRAAALFALAAALFWWKPLFGGRALFYDVLFRLFYPDAMFMKACWASGSAPFWNPHLFSGVPFLANLQSALFYPFTWLYLPLSFASATALDTWLHCVLAALFMRALAKDLELGENAALLSGLLFALNGFFVLHYAYPSNFNAYPWLPLIILFFRRRALALCALALAAQIFAGHPQFVLYSGFALAVVALCADGPLLRRLGRCAAALALGALLASVQLLPTLAFLRETARGAGRGWDWAVSYSVAPLELLKMLLLPVWNLYFSPTTGDPHILGFYIGWPALALAAAALWKPRRRVLPYALIAALGLALCLGEHLPGYRLLYDWCWPFSRFRFPAQALDLACFGLALLAGFGLQRLKLAPRWAALLIGLCVLDLWAFSFNAVNTIEPEFYGASTAGAAFLRSHSEGLRVVMAPKTRLEKKRPGASELEAWLKFRDALYPNLAMAEGLLDADGNDELKSARYEQALAGLDSSPLSPWMDKLSVRHVVSLYPLPAPKFRKAYDGPTPVYENKDAWPRAYLASSLSEGPEPEAAPAPGAPKPVFELDGAGEVRLKAASPRPAWLVLADGWAPGWTATVNGRPAAILRVNLVQRAVRLDAGASSVEFRYRPPLLWAGAALSLAALAFLPASWILLP